MARGADQFLRFRVGEARMAVSAATVSEVLRRSKVTRVPHAPASLLGLVHLRGKTLPVISLARLMGGEESPPTGDARLLLIDADEPLAVAVDAVGALSALGDVAAPRAGQVYVEDGESGRVVDILALMQRDLGAVQRRAPGAAAPGAAPAAAAVVRAPQIALMSFELAEQAYALPLGQVAEVLPLPQRLTSLPGGDAAVLGVLPHRGALLPLVSLRSLLGLDGAPPPGSQVVVTRLGAVTIGFVADRLGSILRVEADRISRAPSVLNRGAGEAQIQSLARLADGRGLVSILSAERLFRDETVARILNQAGQEAGGMAEQATKTRAEQFIIFTLGDEEYGLPIAAVDEIVRLPDRLTRAPRAPAFIEGVINLRGRVLPVIDQRRRFHAPGESAAARRRLIVTTLDERPVAFVVDKVTEVLSAPSERIAPAPSLTADGAQLFDRVVTLEMDGRMILLIDPKELLNRAERDLLAELAAEVAEPGTG
ncbi:MAG TPA: chemotaxis protein CheW [Caulobacteraceae bacterium]|nr:chemotaxis protein CheW [Caulobacteraceae bacterium]